MTKDQWQKVITRSRRILLERGEAPETPAMLEEIRQLVDIADEPAIDASNAEDDAADIADEIEAHEKALAELRGRR